MNSQEIESNNTSELKEFIEKFNLQDNYGNTFFKADIQIITEKRELSTQQKIRITFDGYDNAGTVKITEEDGFEKVPPYLFPGDFKAKYAIFKFIDEEYLEISGNHTQNHEVGKYTVKIWPL